jgi:hypothetical protein
VEDRIERKAVGRKNKAVEKEKERERDTGEKRESMELRTGAGGGSFRGFL